MPVPTWMCGCWTSVTNPRESEQDDVLQASTSWNLFIDLKTLETATDNFSNANLLGRGGFGPVYKGVMENGQEIAVKKLSLESRQGIQQFTTEVRLLLKVQHRNLVSLLGCCASSGEKMLVYPFFPNLSLDQFLFDKKKSVMLDWPKRYEIIVGIAKGLLYLHEESPVKIIHRDIKASNILLDDKLNPKISDFGMARLFLEDDTHVETFRISGTYGYMAPEYAMSGYLSPKTDVFSFGILILEIISGRKNMDKNLDEDKTDLLSYTWKLYQEGRAIEILDPILSSSEITGQVQLCINLGLLCCQSLVHERPNMYEIHIMISSDSFTLPKPGKPAIFGRVGKFISTSTGTATGTGTTFGTNISDVSRNSISVSFTNEGR